MLLVVLCNFVRWGVEIFVLLVMRVVGGVYGLYGCFVMYNVHVYWCLLHTLICIAFIM